MLPRVPITNSKGVVGVAKWGWENDVGGYNEFDAKGNVALEAAWQATDGEGKVKLTLAGRTYEFDFGKMLQTNIDTGYARKVKRTATTLPVTWQLRSDEGAWTSCDTATTGTMEGLYQAGASGTIKVGAQNHRLDFKAMTSKFSCDIRRLQGMKETQSKWQGVVGEAKWEWGSDVGDGYNEFEAKANAALEGVWQATNGKGKVKLTLAGRNYEFDFGKMLQTNIDTGSVRKVKRTATTLPVTWQWKNDEVAWTSCDAAITGTMEDLYQAGAFGTIKVGAQNYQLDFKAMTSKFSCDIRRLQGMKETKSKYADKVGAKRVADSIIIDDDDAPKAKKAYARTGIK